jgi:ribosomal protein S12 methylthiotransferase
MKIFIKKLGCPKNDVDGDYIAGKLKSIGHEIIFNQDQAEIIIVNTCGFILPAKEESIEEILYYEKMKKERKINRLYVTGCMAQRYADELSKDIKGVDGFFGLGKIEDIAKAINNECSGSGIISRDNTENLNFLVGENRFVNRRFPYEYLKIAEGCDRCCAYCAIPSIRGHYRSRTLTDIIKEARLLASCGKKEIILVSQEGTGYGRDFENKANIISLLSELEKVDGIEWIRLMYMHPESVTDQLIEYMTTSRKVLGYFDIPLQHINDKILAGMNRRVTSALIEDRLQKIKKASSNNIIRTTFITGLPGETEGDFSELLDFIKMIKFDRLGIFKYSPEEGTPAYDFDNQVPDEVAEERLDILMTLQQTIAFEKNIALIDSIQKVIIDELKTDGSAIGRTEGDCPEIDQSVYVQGKGLKMGEIINARIVMAEGYDLIARKVSRNV